MTNVVATVLLCQGALVPHPLSWCISQPRENLALFLKLITSRFLRQVECISVTSLLQSKQRLHQVTGGRLQPGPRSSGHLLQTRGLPFGGLSYEAAAWYRHPAGKSFSKSRFIVVWLDGTASNSPKPKTQNQNKAQHLGNPCGIYGSARRGRRSLFSVTCYNRGLVHWQKLAWFKSINLCFSIILIFLKEGLKFQNQFYFQTQVRHQAAT